MSTSVVELRRPQEAWLPPPAKPLDEAVWQAWVLKGREQDRRSSAARMIAVKWLSIAALLAATGPWSHFTLYDAVVRFILSAGAIVGLKT